MAPEVKEVYSRGSLLEMSERLKSLSQNSYAISARLLTNVVRNYTNLSHCQIGMILNFKANEAARKVVGSQTAEVH